MQIYEKIKSFISLVCAILIVVSTLVIPVAADSGKTITASTSTSLKQGSSGTFYVNISSTESLAALDITVHFDSTKIKVNSITNNVSCLLYDNVKNEDNVQFSYLFDGKGTTSNTRLFYFSYQVLSNAEVGDTYFDVTIGEAYDSLLNDVSVEGTRCKLTITETVTNKSCTISSTSSVTTSVQQEFSLTYRFSDYKIATGSAVINYDTELFEVASVTAGSFLDNKIVDINTEFAGAVYVSFVGTEYKSKYDFLTVKFKTIKNVSETSKIALKCTELYDLELNPISCKDYVTSATINFEDAYVKDAPAMELSGDFSFEDKKISLNVSLEEASKLGAGDFVITFDPKLVSYNSCKKGFSPTYFKVDERKTDEGQLIFHIVSLSDIVTDETVLTVEFDVKETYSGEFAVFSIDGTDLTDSLTNKIKLNFIDAYIPLEYSVAFYNWDGSLLQSLVYSYGDIVEEPAEVPAKDSDVYGTYSFNGWDKEVTSCTGTTVYTATYNLKYTDYVITFENWDGTVLSANTYHYGDEVEVPDTPTKDADNTYTYTFAGWDKEVVDCAGNATYTATYTSNYIDYTVVFKNWNGDVLSTKNYHYGDEVVIPETPERNAGNTYTYTFAGWDKEVVDCVGNATYTAVYDKTKIIVTYIEVSSKPSKLIYLEGETFDKSGMVITAYYNNNTSKDVTDYTVSGYTSTPGTKTITISFQGKAATFTVEVKAKTLTHIEVTKLPNKLSYIAKDGFDGGETFNGTGMEVTAYYNNGTSEKVTDYTVSGYTAESIGIKTLTVNHKGKTDTFEVEVIKRPVQYLELYGVPFKTTYIEGEEFNDEGIIVIANYGNDMVEQVSDYTISGYTSTIGTKVLTVEHRGKTTTFEVIVVPKSLTHIEITKLPDKLVYKKGEALDLSGIIITAYFNNGTSQKLYDNEYQIFESVSSTLDKKTVKIVYQGNDAEFDVTVILTQKGDINCDGNVDTTDLAILKLFLAGINDLSEEALLSGDMNDDGNIDTTDLAIIKLELAGIK
ncbi:MAG: hypothetical protein E7565_05370 [Ruminococcaceae bacterium]|nr:hypothetical protein [Oscillospiraceae bacterium]